MARADFYESRRVEAERERNRERQQRIEDEIYASATRDLPPHNRKAPNPSHDDPNEPLGIRTPQMTFTDDELTDF
jgi:hypothetical protein